MTDFEITVRKFGDPLLDPASTPSNAYCLIDRQHRKVILAIADSRFLPLKDEARMVWLREFGVVSDALNQAFAFPAYVEELFAVVSPPDQYSPSKTIPIKFEQQIARESTAWFSRAFSLLLDSEELSGEAKPPFQLEWKNYLNEQFRAPLRDFLKRPRVISQSQKDGAPKTPA
jgi:hypothetical protein